MSSPPPWTRRGCLQSALGMMAIAVWPFPSSARALETKRLKVAAIVTEFTHRSHAHVILENFLEPYYFNGELTESGMDVVSLYVDQTPVDRDMSRAAAETYGIAIYPTIAEALRCGGDTLAVDAVLSIGEHGTYPDNDRGQKMYPRKRFFDEITAVLRHDGRSVPVFNDKHLSYRADWSAEMLQTAKELHIPFMAGSSVPLAQQRPPLDIPPGSVIEDAVSIHSGPMEVYDFHALEVLQSLVEGRKGGETGVREIQLLEGDDVWKAAAEGRWDRTLADVAMRVEAGRDVGPLESWIEPKDGKQHPVHAILITYRDGLRGTMLRLGNSSTRWNFACRLAGNSKPLATSLNVGPWENRNLFKALSHAIQTHFRDGMAPYPVERTHLVTGMLVAAMNSRFEKHRRVATPDLNIAYLPRDFRALRETGATWKIITDDLPEPKGINPGGPRPRPLKSE